MNEYAGQKINSERYRDYPENAQEDEEEMRRANWDVQVMQKQMIDGEYDMSNSFTTLAIAMSASCPLAVLLI